MVDQFFTFLTFGIIIYLIWYFVIKPMVKRVKADRRLDKRIRTLQAMGFNIETPIRDPHLSEEEITLMKENPEPREEDIWKYYQMYCRKHQMDNEDVWTTLEPMSYEEWEKKARQPTEYKKINDRFGLEFAGGYKWMIPKTCDAMVGIPPNHYFQRYHDYAAMVEADNDKFVNELENAEGE